MGHRCRYVMGRLASEDRRVNHFRDMMLGVANQPDKHMILLLKNPFVSQRSVMFLAHP